MRLAGVQSVAVLNLLHATGRSRAADMCGTAIDAGDTVMSGAILHPGAHREQHVDFVLVHSLGVVHSGHLLVHAVALSSQDGLHGSHRSRGQQYMSTNPENFIEYTPPPCFSYQ